MTRRYIIEHPTRGVLKDLAQTESGLQTGRFSYVGNRLSGLLFGSATEAFDALDHIRPESLRARCQVRQEPTDEEIASPNWRGDPWAVVERQKPVDHVTTQSVESSVRLAVDPAIKRLDADSDVAELHGFGKVATAHRRLAMELAQARDRYLAELHESGVS